MTGLLEGKVALITGSSRGIGKATALELARQGADIAVCARSETSAPDFPGTITETADAVRAIGRRAIAVKMDISKDEDIRAGVARTLAELGRIDILVNNAVLYVGGDGGFLASDVDVLTDAMRMNVRAPYLLSQLVVPEMQKAGGGVIFNISSSGARHPPPPEGRTVARTNNPFGGNVSSPIYPLTKAALERLTTGLAAELAPQNIAVIAVAPGFTLTERVALHLKDAANAARTDGTDISAKAIAFLARDPMAYSGRILAPKDIVAENGL